MTQAEIITDLRAELAQVRLEKATALRLLERMIEQQAEAAQATPGALRQRRYRERHQASQSDVTRDVTGDVTDGGNHIGGGPTFPPSSGGGDTSSLTSSPSVVVTPLPPCSPSLSTVRSVFDAYQAAIQPHARLIDAAKDKIRARLKVFSEAELREAIRRFAADSWHMEHNAGRGAAWFFDSDKRIESYVNLPPRNGNGNHMAEPKGWAGLREYQRLRDGAATQIIDGETA